MREKLIEILTSFYGVDPMYFGVEAQALADHLIAHGVTVQQWISVKDRLPEIDQPCLCYKKINGHCRYQLGTYLGASFSEDCAAFKSMSHYGCIGVTHWMPLPQPPKGE